MNITGGEFRGRKIIAPDEKITRPTLSKVRMAVFNTLQALIDFEGKTFFDMYAGSGIMGLEALSRGFKTLYACEKNREVANILQKNYKNFDNLREIHFLCTDSLKCTNKLIPANIKIDVTYIDPPYFSGIYEKSLAVVKNFSEIIILEHVTPVDFGDLEIIKQKKYGDKIVTFVKW